MAVRLVVRRAGAAPSANASGPEQVSYEFEQPRLVIGRSASADVRLPALTVSELHATLERTERGYTLRDEGSTNGTRVNDTVLVPGRARSLHDGDELQVGEFLLKFDAGAPVQGLTSPERTISLAKRLLAEANAQPLGGATLGWHVCGVEQPARSLPAPPARWRVGRDVDADLCFEDPDVSRQQLELEIDLDGVRVRDVGSKNGMFVNGKAMRERRLRDGDRVQLGASELWLDDPAERALRGLEGHEDAAYVPTERAAVPTAGSSTTGGDAAPDGSRDQPTGTREATPNAPEANRERARSEPPKKASMGPDAIIYVLALAVLAASTMGLFWLLSE